MTEAQILQDVNYVQLKDKVAKYQGYKRKENALYIFAMVWLLAFFPMIVTILPIANILYPLVLFIIVLLVIIDMFPLFLWSIYAKKERNVDLEDDEWVRFYSGSIVIDLEEFIKKREAEKKEECRKNALKNAYRLLSTVESWNIGNFLPVKLYVGDSINILKSNLRFKVMSAIKGNNEDIKKAKLSMYALFVLLKEKFNIESIQTINTVLSKQFPIDKPFKMGYSNRILNFAKNHKVLSTFIVGFGLLILCVAVGYGALAYGVSRDNVFVGCIALFGILLGAYLARGRLPIP
jgi:hypothetical protein